MEKYHFMDIKTILEKKKKVISLIYGCAISLAIIESDCSTFEILKTVQLFSFFDFLTNQLICRNSNVYPR